MPTTRPRYTITDTGEITDALDLAQLRWPDITDRRQLLLRLAAAGRDAIADEVDVERRAERRDRQRAALSRAPQLVDFDELPSDAAWR